MGTDNTPKSEEEELLMIDSSLGNGPAEHMMDYVISYTLRSFNNKKKPIFASYCRKILFKLLDLEDNGEEILSVKVWKQWKFTDLTAEITIKHASDEKKYALLIENKYYSTVRRNARGELQTDVYKEIMEEHYRNKGFEMHYVLICCVTHSQELFKAYDCVKTSGYKVFSIYDFHETGQPDCESDIFNQFWLRSWS
ncbi:MAG: hypothetical protein K2M52_02495 [Paramuribaculum sp.]|nr:hypothetical protein [Paramuribaculum sp.]MDE7452182.1 hypothetical protein [Paramuribaculum sp.]